MAVREKVALLFTTVVLFHAISYTDSLPKNIAKRTGAKQVLNATPAPRITPKTRKIHINEEDVCEKFNFPEIQYPTASTPNAPLYFHDFGNKIRDQPTDAPRNKRLDKHRQHRKLKTKQSEQGVKAPEFSSAPCYRDVGTFPEVEYPLDNKDVWRPNFWNCPPKSVSTNVTTKSTRRGVHAVNTKFKTKNRHVTPVLQSYRTKYNGNRPGLKEVELPTKKRSHDQSHEKFYDNSYTATPTPQLQDEITALRAKLASNIAQKAVSMIKDKVHSRTTTEHTFNDDDLEELLCLPRNFNSYTLVDSKNDLDNTTESAINVFTAFTEPELNKANQANALGTDNTSLLPLSDINTDTLLSPRGSHTINRLIEHNDDKNKVILYNQTSSDTDNNEINDDYTTDDPSDSFVLSTVSPIDNWRNTNVIDPFKSVSYPDELDEYYLAVN